MDIGKKVSQFDYSEPFEQYTGVTVSVSDSASFSAGTTTGRTLTIDCPWGTQAMADDLLAQVLGYQYKPYTASGAILDPAAEAGDAVTVAGVTSGIYSRKQKFSRLYRADISAPGEEEVDHEIPYYPPIQRAVNRVGSVARSAAASAAANKQKILEDRKELIAALNQQDGAPTDLAAGLSAYVRYDLDNNEGYAESSLFARIGEEAEAKIDQYVVTVDGADKTLKEAVTTITTRVGNVESGLSQKVSTGDLTETLKNYALASALNDYLTVNAAAELYATDDDVIAAIGAYIVTDQDGNKKSLAAILADVIKLQGDTEILGNLSVDGGNLKVSKSIVTDNAVTGASVYANGSGSQGIISGRRVACSELAIGGTEYTPQQITSSSGAVLSALGCA